MSSRPDTVINIGRLIKPKTKKVKIKFMIKYQSFKWNWS